MLAGISPATVARGTTAVAILTVANTSVLQETTIPVDYTFDIALAVYDGGSFFYIGSQQISVPANSSITLEWPFAVNTTRIGKGSAYATLKTTDGRTILSSSIVTFTIV